MSFRLSAILGDNFREMDVPAVADLLGQLRSGEMRGEAVIYPAIGDFPRTTIDWHARHGFVLFCLDNEESRGYFLTRDEVIGGPLVQVVLGGQAMENWPPELFVPEVLAAEALGFFLETGQRKPELCWVRTDQFPREIVWEGHGGREAWERRRRERGNA